MPPIALAPVGSDATWDRLFSRTRAAFRWRAGSLLVLIALGWPLMLPLFLALRPGYVELEYNSLPALFWVWFPSAAALLTGLVTLVIPWVRDRRVPAPVVGIALVLVAGGFLRVGYEHDLDLWFSVALRGSGAVPGLLKVTARKNVTSRVTSRTRAASSAVLILGTRGVPRLSAALTHPDWAVRASAAGLLAQLGSEAAAAEPALVASLTDPDARVRSAAAGAVLSVTPTTRFNVPVLVAILNGGASLDRQDASVALADLGPNASGAVPALIGVLKDP